MLVLAACGTEASQEPIAFCAEPNANASTQADIGYIKLFGTAEWATTTTMIGTTFEFTDQVKIKLEVNEANCIHRLDLFVSSPRIGAVPYGVLSHDRNPVVSGVVWTSASDTDTVAEGSEMNITALGLTKISATFTVLSRNGYTFTEGKMTDVEIFGERPQF